MLQSWEESFKMEWIEKLAAHFRKFQILVFICSYEIEVNYLLPNCKYNKLKGFLFGLLYIVEVWSISKIFQDNTENSAVNLIQQR